MVLVQYVPCWLEVAFGLPAEQLGVVAVGRHQVIVLSGLGQLAVPKHEDAVRVAYGVQAM